MKDGDPAVITAADREFMTRLALEKGWEIFELEPMISIEPGYADCSMCGETFSDKAPCIRVRVVDRYTHFSRFLCVDREACQLRFAVKSP